MGGGARRPRGRGVPRLRRRARVAPRVRRDGAGARPRRDRRVRGPGREPRVFGGAREAPGRRPASRNLEVGVRAWRERAPGRRVRPSARLRHLRHGARRAEPVAHPARRAQVAELRVRVVRLVRASRSRPQVPGEDAEPLGVGWGGGGRRYISRRHHGSARRGEKDQSGRKEGELAPALARDPPRVRARDVGRADVRAAGRGGAHERAGEDFRDRLPERGVPREPVQGRVHDVTAGAPRELPRALAVRGADEQAARDGVPPARDGAGEQTVRRPGGGFGFRVAVPVGGVRVQPVLQHVFGESAGAAGPGRDARRGDRGRSARRPGGGPGRRPAAETRMPRARVASRFVAGDAARISRNALRRSRRPSSR